MKADEPEETSESETLGERAEEKPPEVIEEPKEEEVEPLPLISTEDTGDLLVSCLSAEVMIHLKLIW